MSLRQFLDAPANPDRSLVVLNRSAPDPLQRMLDRMFKYQSVPVEEVDWPDEPSDQVLLVEDGAVIAQSALADLQDAILMINSDLFITGARKLDEIELPAVIERLDEISFFLRGFPESNSEKLLLILMSRAIERLAFDRDAGRLRTSFQRLNRIQDEIGTRQVYDRLDSSNVDVHVYGAPGWTPPPGSSITAHAGYSADFLESWFVVYQPPSKEDDGAALLAIEEDSNEWNGFWTYRHEVVTDLTSYISQHL